MKRYETDMGHYYLWDEERQVFVSPPKPENSDTNTTHQGSQVHQSVPFDRA